MKGGEGFGKLPPRGPLKPRPKKEPVWRKGVRPGKTSYEKAKVGRTEPEAKTPASPEGGVPPTTTPIQHLLSHYGPWGVVLVVVGSLLIVSVFIYLVEFAFNPSSPGTSTPPPPAQEGGVTQPVAGGPFSGTWQGNYQCRYLVDQIYWTETSDISASVTIYLRQEGSDVDGIIITDNYKDTCVSSDPDIECVAMIPFASPSMYQITLESGEILYTYWLTGTVDANDNLNITCLELLQCDYVEGGLLNPDEIEDFSVSVSGNSMTLIYYSMFPQHYENNVSLTLTKVSGQYDEQFFR